jgi:hypothetical protein
MSQSKKGGFSFEVLAGISSLLLMFPDLSTTSNSKSSNRAFGRTLSVPRATKGSLLFENPMVDRGL